MIGDEYFHLNPQEEYNFFSNSCLFLGTRIKNRYDEKRIKIDEKFKPLRLKIKKSSECFYGNIIKLPVKYESIFNKIKESKPFDYIGYSNLLSSYGLTCNQEFYKLSNFFYPIDYEHVKSLKPDFDYGAYLCLNDGSSDFQSFAQPELFIISID